jgi:hypothetical protein
MRSCGCGRRGSPLYAHASTAQGWRVTSVGSGRFSASLGTRAAGADAGRLRAITASPVRVPAQAR